MKTRNKSDKIPNVSFERTKFSHGINGKNST